MNEYKAKKVMELLEKVIKINATKGTKLVADLNNNGLHVCDANNDCKPVMYYQGITGTIYFDEYWDRYFEDLVAAMHEALDKYLEADNE